jgi:hypothetical protein
LCLHFLSIHFLLYLLLSDPNTYLLPEITLPCVYNNEMY